MFEFITHPLLTRLLESRIKSALLERDENKTHLKQWLAVAHGGQFDAEALQYQFSDGKSLVDFGIESSDANLAQARVTPPWYERWIFGASYRRSYLLKAQTYYKSVMDIWIKNKQMEQKTESTQITLRWYHRLLYWCIRVSGLQWTFKSTDLKDDALFAKLREHEGVEEEGKETHSPHVNLDSFRIHMPSFREKHSVAKLLSSPHIILKRMTQPKGIVSLENQTAQASSIIPPHMQHWITTLRFNQTVDQAHQQTVQQEQNVETVVDIADLQRIHETAKWTDDSALSSISNATQRLNELKYTASAKWIESLDWACRTSANRSSQHTVLISEAACDKIINAKGHVRSDFYLDLDSLPLGFFIDKNTAGNVFTLKYNEKYRLHQLATQTNAVTRIDVNQIASDFHFDPAILTCTVTKDDLLNTLRERGVHLKPEHLDFLNQLDKETHHVKFECMDETAPRTDTKAYAFRALKMMTEAIYPLPTEHVPQKMKQDPFLGEFIECLDRFSKMDQSLFKNCWNNYEKTSAGNYLNRFILNYLKGITNAKEFYTNEARNALKRYATFNDNELAWLDRIESSTRYSSPNFAETSKGLLYFFDFINGLGVSVPDPEHYSGATTVGGFIELKHYLDCLSLAGHGKNILAKRIQAEYLVNMPKDKIAKNALKAGYAFVHEAMIFEYSGGYTEPGFSSFSLSHKMTGEEFGQLQYGVDAMKGVSDAFYFRALYLRFIAYHVEPQYFKAAINQWEQITNTKLGFIKYYSGRNKDLDTLDSALRTHWKELQDYILSLPSVMASQTITKASANVSDAFLNEKEALIHAERLDSPEQVDALLEKINIPEALSNKIKRSIEQLNTLTESYANLSEQDLQRKLQSMKHLPLESRIACLREAHCRLTCSQSTATPPQGEWLRLEQLVSVLVAMNEDSLLQIDTGEGKTFILQLIALLKALNGQRVNVLTHNESLALDAGDKIKKLAHLTGIKTAKHTDAASSIIDADIVYMDISSAVINDLLAQHAPDDQPRPGQRKADVAIVDEVDNVVIDIHANTTMQISRGSEEAKEDLERFLNVLNTIVRTELPKQTDLTEKIAQRAFIRARLNDALFENPFYRTHCKDDAGLDPFICAAISASTLTRDVDYAVEEDNLVIHDVTISRKVVHIMHKDTTGRSDKLSQWGNHIHQCVAAHEKQQNNPDVVIPGLSDILATGDIDTYLNTCYASRIGVSATMGNERVRHKIEEIMKTKQTVEIPRAIRPLEAGTGWPLKAGKPVYSRLYRFPPVYKESRESHYEMLLEAVQNIQDDNQSAILFWNTIAECDDFFAYLKEKGINTQTIQILDDTHDEEKARESQAFRPSEATVIARAKEPRMITLTTAAGSRGTDFDNINVGILVKPNLERVTLQKAGRIARNGQFGQVYEIYNTQDLNRSNPENADTQTDNKINLSMMHRSRIFTHEKAAEESTLNTIEQHKPK